VDEVMMVQQANAESKEISLTATFDGFDDEF
jgi:hypothetical protein